MKKVLCALLALFLALSFAACSKKNKDDNDLDQYKQNEEVVEKIKQDNGDVFSLESVDTMTLIITAYKSAQHELHELIIPDTLAGKKVIGIGNEAFKDCDSLTAVTIPNTVTSIGDYAFAGCHFLERVEIPASVKTIGKSAFYGCEKLTALSFAEDGALEEIPYACFMYCTSLESVTIPGSIKTVGKGAFFGCTSLSTLVVEEGAGPVEICDQAFQNLPVLVNVTLPENAVYDSHSFSGTPWAEN